MSGEKYKEALTCCEVPDMLDRRILAAARCKAAQAKRKHIVWRRIAPAVGIAAAFAIGFGVIFFQHGKSAVAADPSRELLAMNDWTELEQITYNLNFELDDSMSILADTAWARGF